LIKILQVRNIDSFVESRRQKTSEKDRKTVQSILNDVRKNGDSAVKKYERKFNGRKTSQLRVSAKEIKEARSKISREEVTALQTMSARLSNSSPKIQIRGSRKFVAIPSVGCYIPGGQARYPSSVVMSVIPAKIAGVKRIVIVSPPDRDGKIDPLTIVAAKKCGATEIYKIGGAQAIGALAYGTKSIPKVDKIVGPGGKFVSIAKSLVSDQTAIDMIAGPTELGIIADASSDPELIALDKRIDEINNMLSKVKLEKKQFKLLNELEEYVENAEMNIKSTQVFGYARTSTLSRLVYQAKNNHYSTFALYDEETFDESLDIFQKNIQKNFNDLEQITWHDENILLEIEK